MSQYTLLTGATGLLGRYLMRDLLQRGVRLAVLARPSKRESARQRIEGILQMWESQLGCDLPRPVCLEGDICSERLGLDEQAVRWVRNHCPSMLHSAASLSFHAEPNGEPWRSNVGGTRNMLDLCQAAGIRQLHYVSTAYVCGLRRGRIMESDLDFGQPFRNDYEKSKLEAETLVRQADFLDCLTVYRPAVIAGDSITGYTNTYHGLYMYLKLMSVLVWNTEPGPDGVRDTPVRLEMTGDEPRNIVPVDWVSEAMCRLFTTPAAHGDTYHLAPVNPITPRQIIEAGYKYFNSRGVEFVGPPVPERMESEDGPISDIDRNAHENMHMYKEYEDSDPEFDTTNLLKFTSDLPCPDIDEVMLHRFWRYGEEDRWGKRKQPVVKLTLNIEALLTRVRGEHDTSDTTSNCNCGGTRQIGIDIIGAGGGQWTLFLRDGNLSDFIVGIASTSEAVVKFTSYQFTKLLDNVSLEEPSEDTKVALASSRLSGQSLTETLLGLLSSSPVSMT
ncbi:MAG: SDR family oxidoreductase [Pirellulaceae bacterium]